MFREKKGIIVIFVLFFIISSKIFITFSIHHSGVSGGPQHFGGCFCRLLNEIVGDLKFVSLLYLIFFSAAVAMQSFLSDRHPKLPLLFFFCHPDDYSGWESLFFSLVTSSISTNT